MARMTNPQLVAALRAACDQITAGSGPPKPMLDSLLDEVAVRLIPQPPARKDVVVSDPTAKYATGDTAQQRRIDAAGRAAGRAKYGEPNWRR